VCCGTMWSKLCGLDDGKSYTRRFRAVPRSFPGSLLGPGNILVVVLPRDAQRALTHQESGLKASLLTLLLPEGRALSDPLPVTSASIERACEAPLAESAARCATRGDIGFFGISFTDIPNGVADGIDEVRKAVRE